ncbi:MAG: metallophosphoesterase [Candidatus Omnitrophica bacterium]|nr:metallophosphoesterase [Candidatus Omnitrophota bacterium]
MKIIVLSDTHIPSSCNDIDPEIYKELKKCDFVIHAGDVVEMQFLKKLAGLAELKAVHGNMDSADIKNKFPEKIVFTAGSKKIGVVHGYGPRRTILAAVNDAFKKDKPDIIIFGHSHEVYNQQMNGTLYFNPGSPTDLLAPKRSFGIIDIDNSDITPRIIYLS